MPDLTPRPAFVHEVKASPTPEPDAVEHFKFAHSLLFTGHMIDSTDRAQPRFPPWAESRARSAIRERVAGIAWTEPGPTIGLAGAASGGDLLFHEICEELAIPTLILLALPVDGFLIASVAPAGPAWVERFGALLERRGREELHIMRSEDGLLEGQTSNIWQRANLWMIEQAVNLAPERALLALWDGKAGDGPGGTEHFLQIAQKSGIRVVPHIEMHLVLQP
jgi:hypothetical protein